MYPPGMTKRDWAHIDGEQHYAECPQHEDAAYLTDCCSALWVGESDICMHCHEHAGRQGELACECEDIAEGIRIDAALLKWDETR